MISETQILENGMHLAANKTRDVEGTVQIQCCFKSIPERDLSMKTEGKEGRKEAESAETRGIYRGEGGLQSTPLC